MGGNKEATYPFCQLETHSWVGTYPFGPTPTAAIFINSSSSSSSSSPPPPPPPPSWLVLIVASEVVDSVARILPRAFSEMLRDGGGGLEE